MAHEGIPLPIIQRQLGHAHLGSSTCFLACVCRTTG
jgi:hypothetical protein